MSKYLNIVVEYPDDCPTEHAKEYIKDSLGFWGGSLFPGDDENPPDPLFNGVTVKTVRPIKRPKHVKS